MIRPVVLTVALILFVSPTFAQHGKTTANHTQNVKTIDGAKTPELIPDNEAYRLWFVVQGTMPDASQEEVLKHRDNFRKLDLGENDSVSLSLILTKFKSEYQQLIDEHNRFVGNVYPAVTDADYAQFLVKRDALVDKFIKQVNQVLTPRGASQLGSIIQSEKRHMKLQVPDHTN